MTEYCDGHTAKTRAEKLTEQARQFLSLTGPQLPDQPDHMVIKGGYAHEPQPYICVICDREFPTKWQMQIHNATNPEYCQKRGAEKQRAWAARN